MLSCLICQDAISDNPSDNNYPWVLSCGHVYHKQCIEQSLRSNNNCPKCRKHVTKSFRLFPEVLNRSETVTFLQGCVQSAELQYARQKKQCDEKETIIQGLRNTLEDVETRNIELRTSNVNYTKTVQEQVENYIARIKKLQDNKTRLNGELNKSVQQVAQHEATITNLQRKLQVENELFKAASKAKVDSESTCRAAVQQIQILNAKLDNAKQETLARDAEISRLEAQVAATNEQIRKLSERVPVLRSTDTGPLKSPPNPFVSGSERVLVLRPTDPSRRPTDPSRRPTDPGRRPIDPVDEMVDDLARDFQQIAIPVRKRKPSDDPGSSLTSQRVEKSVKQLRPDSEDDTSPQDGDTSEIPIAEPSTSSQTVSPEKPQRARSKRFAVRKILKVVKFDDSE